MKKLNKPGNEKLAMDLYHSVLVNGVEYCRTHLLLRCHLCQLDFRSLREEVEMEREELDLRPGGDSRLDHFSDKWESKVEEPSLLRALQGDIACIQYGPRDLVEEAQKMNEYINNLPQDDRAMNAEFMRELKELKSKGVSECAYWACENPSTDKLLVCAGCKFHKYCCKDHQRLDWVWEHRAECTPNVPKCVLVEVEATMKRNLAGDYSPA